MTDPVQSCSADIARRQLLADQLAAIEIDDDIVTVGFTPLQRDEVVAWLRAPGHPIAQGLLRTQEIMSRTPAQPARKYDMRALAKFLYEHCALDPDKAGDVAATLLEEYIIWPDDFAAQPPAAPVEPGKCLRLEHGIACDELTAAISERDAARYQLAHCSAGKESADILRKFANAYRSGAQGADMDYDVAQRMALAIDDMLDEPKQSAGNKPAAWLSEYDGHTDATTDPDTVRIWRETLHRTVTPLYSAEPQGAPKS